jgi:hypothetical protein
MTHIPLVAIFFAGFAAGGYFPLPNIGVQGADIAMLWGGTAGGHFRH